MDHEVAGLERFEFAQRKPARRLAALAAGRSVVAVEDLVVGVDHEPGLRHLEPFVQRLDQEPRLGLADFQQALAAVYVEQVAEARALRAGVAEQEDLGTAGLPRLDGLAEPPDVRVEVWLRHAAHGDGVVGVVGEEAEEELRVLREASRERVGLEKALGGGGDGGGVAVGRVVFEAGGVALLRLLEQLGGALAEAPAVEKREQRAVRQVVEERDVGKVRVAGVEVGHEAGAFSLRNRALAAGLELADRVDLVAEKLDAHRVVARKGKHVQNAAAQGDFAGLGHELDGHEALVHEMRHQVVRRHLVAHVHRFRFLLHYIQRRHQLAHGVEAGDDDALEAAAELLEHVGAAGERAGVGDALAVVGRAAGGGEVEQRGVAAEQLFEIGPEVGRGVGVREEAEQRAPAGASLRGVGHVGQEKRGERAGGAFDAQRSASRERERRRGERSGSARPAKSGAYGIERHRDNGKKSETVQAANAASPPPFAPTGRARWFHVERSAPRASPPPRDAPPGRLPTSPSDAPPSINPDQPSTAPRTNPPARASRSRAASASTPASSITMAVFTCAPAAVSAASACA